MTAASTAPGHPWWGRSWLDALEQRAKLDPNRLPHGQDYAPTGAVGDLVLALGKTLTLRPPSCSTIHPQLDATGQDTVPSA